MNVFSEIWIRSGTNFSWQKSLKLWATGDDICIIISSNIINLRRKNQGSAQNENCSSIINKTNHYESERVAITLDRFNSFCWYSFLSRNLGKWRREISPSNNRKGTKKGRNTWESHFKYISKLHIRPPPCNDHIHGGKEKKIKKRKINEP